MAVMQAWKQLSSPEKACLSLVFCTLLILPVLLLLPSTPKPPAAIAEHEMSVQHGNSVQHSTRTDVQADAAHHDEVQQAQRTCLLDAFHSGKSPERRVFSQYGEDGITEAIFRCIGTTDKYYVEFGVQDGRECGTHRLREEDKWTGLLMDGGFDIPAINLHKEFMTAANIVSLFNKYEVPSTFDFLTVDLDLNTFYVAQAVLAGGFRPRVLAVEYNSNLGTLNQSYSVVHEPSSMWVASCYYGASALAFTRLMHFYGYLPLHIDQANVNMFFIHSSAVGGPASAEPRTTDPDPQFNLEEAVGAMHKLYECAPSHCAAFPYHGPCTDKTWVQVPGDTDFANPDWEQQLPHVKLQHDEVELTTLDWWGKGKEYMRPFKSRTFVEVTAP